MNDPKRPFHAKSHYTWDGLVPFQCGRPAEEADFRTLEEAREWLEQNGGGVVEKCCNACQHFEQIETVRPADASNRPAIHGSRRIKRA